VVVHPPQALELMPQLLLHSLRTKPQAHNYLEQMQMQVREVLWERAVRLQLALHHHQQPALFLGVGLPGKQVSLDLNPLGKWLHLVGYSLPLNLHWVLQQIHYLVPLSGGHLLLDKGLSEIISLKLRHPLSVVDWLLQRAGCLARLIRLQHLDLPNQLKEDGFVGNLHPRLNNLNLSLNPYNSST
jgi:hypothetical protein